MNRGYINSVFGLLIGCFAAADCVGQIELPFDTIRNKEAWIKFFDSELLVKTKDTLIVHYKTDNEFPRYWIFDDDNNCTECNYLYHKINSRSHLLIMSNGGNLGEYVFYFDQKNQNKNWVQKNFQADSIKLFQIGDDFLCIKLFNSDESTGTEIKRFVLLNIVTGEICKNVVDSTINYEISFTDNRIYLVTSDGMKVLFNDSKMMFSPTNCSETTIQLTFYEKIKKLSFI